MTEQDVWGFAWDAAVILGGFTVVVAVLILGFVWAIARMRETGQG